MMTSDGAAELPQGVDDFKTREQPFERQLAVLRDKKQGQFDRA